MVIIPELKLGYQNVPKIATTSWFGWLHQICPGTQAMRDAPPRQYFIEHKNGSVQGGKGGIIVENSAAKMGEYADHYRFAITRDPVKRFLSMYSNRVVHHRELSARHVSAGKVAANGLRHDPQINELVANLDLYLASCSSVRHHSLPMMDFLGPDLSVYSTLADISKSGDILTKIRSHLVSVGLEDVARNSPAELPRRQTGGPKLTLNALSEESFERLLDYYRQDYALIPTISLDGIKDEYRSAIKSGPAEPVTFRPQGKEAKEGAKKTGRLKRNLPVVVKTQACEWIQESWAALVEKDGCVELTGFLLATDSAHSGYRVVLAGGSDEREVSWGLPSPKLAERVPGNSRAANSRIRLMDVPLEGITAARLLLVSPDDKRHVVATFEKRGKKG